MDRDKKLKQFIKQPTYQGGNEAFKQAIYGQLRYPTDAIKHGTQGIVFIEYDIDYKGNVVETRLLQGIGHGCDEEACRVIKTLKFDVPTNRGMRIMFHKKVKVQFTLPNQAIIAPVTDLQPMQMSGQVQYHYTVTPSTPVVPKLDETKPASQTVTYHITIK
jgi:TonB family protein